MAQKVKVSTYMKRVGKSFGYAVREVSKDYAPILASTLSDTKSTFNDVRISMQEIKNGSISQATRDFKNNDNFIKNTIDDLKTGNWYNQERKDKALGFDFDFDLDFDDDDWGDWGDNDSSDVDTSSVLEHDEMNTKQLISSMGQVGSDISKSLGYTSAKSAEYIVANNNASSRALYDLNAKGFNQVSTILLNMSGSLAGLVKLGEPLADHMQNSSVFYATTTESLNKIRDDVSKMREDASKMNENLQILVDRTAYIDKKNSPKENKNSYGKFMSGNDFSLSSYIDMVKDNVKEQSDTVKSIFSMMEMMMGKNGKNTSLTEAVLKGTVEKIIPQITKDIAKQFDEALSASLGNGLMRAGKAARNKGFLASMLADMFLPKEVVKNSVSSNNFEKGPVAWDGIARQSLTYVIPTYLAQMTALLAGVNDERDYQYYDFKSGKFTTKRIYQKEKEIRDRSRARSVGGEFEDLALKSTNNKQIQKEVQEFFYQAMLNGGDFYDIKKGKTDANWRKKYGNISEETVELLLQVINDANTSGPNKNRNMASKWETRNNHAIYENSRRMQEEELLGYSFENRFVDGTSDFILRSAVGGNGRGRRGSGERNQSIYRNPISSDSYSYNSNKNWRQNEDGTFTVGENNIIISAADFNKWLDAFESGDIKTARKIENTKAMKDAKDKASNMARNVFNDKVKGNQKVTNVLDLLERGRDVIQTPMYAVTMAMDSLNRGINNLFWGDGSEEGVIDKLKKKINNIWDKIKDKFDDLFGTRSYRALKKMGLSDDFVDIVRTVDKRGYIRYYGIDSEGKKHPVKKEVGERYEEETRKKSLKEAMSDEWGKIRQAFKQRNQAARERREALSAELAKFKEMSGGFDNGNAAAGRQVTKAGFAIVSEGEMIIPSEFNPYYHDITNKSKQIANEERIRRNFFGSFSDGGIVYNRIGNGNLYTDNKGGYYEYDEKTKKYNSINIKEAEGRKKVTSGYKSAIANSGPVGAISEGAKTLAGGIMDFINGVIGKNDEKSNEKEKDKIFSNIKKSMQDAGDEKGALGIGAVTGAGVSLLTGAVVGPLAGAAIGAGVGLAIKSKAFQDLLFGTGDPESDDYEKGLLGALGTKLKDKNNQKILKGMGIGGGAGLVAGTLMGSPILGLITGSTLGYISKSQKAQEFLFGTEDNKTALGKLKDKVKKTSPNIAAGALAGLFVGPFGVVGNLLVGSGLGYVSSTEEFKKFMFGDGKENKGLVGKIHDKIVNPLDEIMHNLSNAINGFIRRMGNRIFDIFKSFGSKLKNAVEKASKKDSFLGRFLSGAQDVGQKVIGGTVDFAGNVLDRFDTGLKKSNLNTGSSVYNKALGRNETAEERMRTRQILRNGGVTTKQDSNGNTLYYKVNANGKEKLINEKKYNKILQRNQKRGAWKENSKFGKIDKAISEMDEETIKNLGSNKEEARLKMAEILGKDADKIKNSDLAQFLSLLGDEKSGRFSDENKEKEKEAKQDTMVNTINDNIPKIYEIFGTVSSYLEEIRDKLLGKKSDKGAENPESSESEDIDSTGPSSRDLVEDQKEKTVTQTDMFGNVHQYTENNQGELTEVKNDKETSNSRKIIENFTENIGGIGKIGSVLGGIGGILGAIKNGLLGDGEKKPGILSKLFSGLFGEDGAFSGLLTLFTGIKGGVKGIVKNIFSKGGATIFKSLLQDIGIGALIYAGFSGKLDSISSSIVGLIGGKGANDALAKDSIEESRTYEVVLDDGSTVTATKDKDGNFVDANGNILNVKKVNNSKQNNVGSFSDRLKYNTARGVLTGTGTLAGTLIKKSNIGKAVTKKLAGSTVAKDMANVLKNNTDDYAGLLLQSSLSDSLSKVAAKLAPVLAKMGISEETTTSMFGELATKIANSATSGALKNAAKIAGQVVVIARIAFAVVDFTTGYEDARTTLGIIKEPTVGQKILSGLLRLIKNLIPIVGTLIPDSLVIDVFCNYIAPALGIDISELKNAREEAQQKVDEYNQATGKDLSVAEFTKSVMKDYTWTERIGNAAKGTWEDAKARNANIMKSVKENGVVGTFKNMASESLDLFKQSYTENGGGLSGALSAMGDTFGNMLPGIFGEITKKNLEIQALATKGDIKGLWKVSLDDFSGGKDIEGTDIKTAVPSIFSRVIGQIPLIMNKIFCTPVSLMFKVLGKVKEAISPIIDKVKGTFEATRTAFTTGADMLKSGGEFSFSQFMDTSEITEDPDNPMGGIASTIVKISRFISLPAMLLKAGGIKIKNSIMSIIDKARNSITNLGQDYLAAEKLAQDGDIMGLLNADLSENDDEGSPLGPFTKAINIVQKLMVSPTALMKWAGNKVKDKFVEVKDKVVTGYSRIMDSHSEIVKFADQGDVSSIWNNEVEDDEGNPLGGIYKAVNFAQKVSMTPTGIFNFLGNKLKEVLHVDEIKSDISSFSKTLLDIQGYAKDGDLDSIMSTDAKFSDDNPIKSIFNVGITINKLFSAVVAMVNKLIGPVKELAEGVGEKLGDIKEGVIDTAVGAKDAVVDTANSAWNGAKNLANSAWNGATNWISDTFGGGSSGFVSQYDPRYQKYQVSGQQFGAKGCGPAVASMAASALGKNLSVGDAVRASNGYQTDNGVTLDYFQNALGSRGINTEIIAGGSSADIYKKIASGQKVILLGQDATNTSKKNSPFGPNNHYVLATGIDRRGNVIVNDPESKGPRTYSPNILSHTKYGIAGSNSGMRISRASNLFRYIAGGGNPRNDEITQQIWAYLTTKLGMSEAAAAGVMGNMEQESGCQPNINQKGGGAFGICQWDGGRRDKLKQLPNYQNLNVQLDYLAQELPSQPWNKSGTINDVDGKAYTHESMTYDQFKSINDVATATIKFEAAFERAGKPHLANRINYAKAYYEMFTGKTYSIDPNIGTSATSNAVGSTGGVGSTGDSSTGSTSSGSDKSSSGGIFNILSTITSAFTNAFSGKKSENAAARYGDSTGSTGGVGGTDGYSSPGVSDGSTYNPVDPNFTSKSPVAWMKSILGQISYSMSGPRNPEQGSADCSSTVRWAIKKAGGPDIGGSTVAQLDNENLAPVWDGNGSYASDSILNSLKPNDVIFFSRPTSSFTEGRKYRVGHVGLYEGNGKYIDHGSGMGPKEKDLKFGEDGKIVRVSRIKSSGANSGIYSYGDLALAAGGSSGLLMASRAGSNKPGTMTFRDSNTGRLLPRVSGGESDIATMATTMLNSVRTNISSKSKSGTVSAELVTELLESITKILNNIADNTAPVSKIYNALSAYISSGAGTAMDKVTVTKKPETPQQMPTEVDSNIATLAGVLAELAKG